MTDFTVAQQRVVDDLLAWKQPRPEVPVGYADDLERRLEAVIAPAAARIPAGERLWLSKGSLDALVCDGRWIDQQETPFEVHPRMIAGTLTHRAVELDQGSNREVAPEDIVTHAWDDLATRPGSYAEAMQSSDRLAASAMRHQSAQALVDFRDTFPLLPATVSVRSEVKLRATLAGGKVVLSGVPDLVVGEARDNLARLLLIDLKTGQRYEAKERQDLRFYGLLATLKYRQFPFRWATFYLAEGAWDAEDHQAELLDGVVRRIGRAVQRLVTLTFERPDDRDLQLQGGPQCRFCTRRPDCAAAVHDQDD